MRNLTHPSAQGCRLRKKSLCPKLHGNSRFLSRNLKKTRKVTFSEIVLGIKRCKEERAKPSKGTGDLWTELEGKISWVAMYPSRVIRASMLELRTKVYSGLCPLLLLWQCLFIKYLCLSFLNSQCSFYTLKTQCFRIK